MTKRIQSVIFVILYVICFLVARVIAMSAVPLYNTLYENGNIDTFIFHLSRVQNSAIYVMAAALVVTLIMFLFIFRLRKQKLADYILREPLTVRSIGASVFITFGLIAVTVLISMSGILSQFVDDYNISVEFIRSSNLWTALVIVGILTPLFEEIMYRGIILGELNRSFSFFSANLIQALVFGAMHFNPIQSAYTFIIGFVLGYAYKSSKTIYLTMLIHILFNASNIFSGWIPYLGFTWLIITAAGALAFGFILLRKKEKA